MIAGVPVADNPHVMTGNSLATQSFTQILFHQENDEMQTIALRQMKKGQSGSIRTVKAAGELGRRIREMGLIPGAKVTICGKAPLQDPVALRVLNTTLTLRNNEADFIQVDIL